MDVNNLIRTPPSDSQQIQMDAEGRVVRSPEVEKHIAALTAHRDALLAIVKKLARYKSGPPPHKRPEWIGKMLDLADEARTAIALTEPQS